MMTEGDLRWIKNWKPKGFNMKKNTHKRLVDVLDEKFNDATGDFLKQVTDKIVKLFYLVTRDSGKLSTHPADLEWCRGMMDKVANGAYPTKKELTYCNELWKMYK